MLLQAATVQGLGPFGWFDVATADRFELPDSDMVSGSGLHPTSPQYVLALGASQGHDVCWH
jgi:hypothetical protein